MPPTELRPNNRAPEYVKRERGREYALRVWSIIYQTLGPRPWPRFARARLHLRAEYPTYANWVDDDCLMASFKRGRDVLTDPLAYKKIPRYAPPRAGLIADDSRRHLEMERPEFVRNEAIRAPRLVVTLAEIGG